MACTIIITVVTVIDLKWWMIRVVQKHIFTEHGEVVLTLMGGQGGSVVSVIFNLHLKAKG